MTFLAWSAGPLHMPIYEGLRGLSFCQDSSVNRRDHSQPIAQSLMLGTLVARKRHEIGRVVHPCGLWVAGGQAPEM